MSSHRNVQKINGNIANKVQHQHQQQQPPSSSSSSSSTSQIPQLHQKPHHHHLQVNSPAAIHSSSSTGLSTSTVVVQQQISSGHHSNTSGPVPVNGISTQVNHHIIPPRYQPPPQPPAGGILKHIPGTQKIGYYPPPDTSTGHINIKYPPEIPKLASVYIPDTVKPTSGNPPRLAQRLQPQQQQQHRIPAGHIPVLIQNQSQLHHDEHIVRQQQQHQQQQQQQQQHQQQQQTQQQQHQDMLKFVRKADPDPASSVSSNGNVVSNSGRFSVEQNRHLQSLLAELRALKEANQRLIDDNQELRDLCCFLDDDRQKGRKLAREWQRFGRYTASVMRQEVSAYQNKLRQLDDKQQELIRDNLELKELCLYLDEERAHVAANTLCANCGASTRPTLRDDGDGSSSSTNADETISAIRQFERPLPELNLRSTLSDQTLQYVRSLERRIRQLEEERTGTTGTANIQQQISDPISGRPEAVVRALQVLEVREQLERDKVGGNQPPTPEQMDDGEKALVREMCNVVWRKLEESPNGPTNMDPI